MGDARQRAASPDRDWAVAELTVGEAATASLELTMGAGGTVSGQVTIDGHDARGAADALSRLGVALMPINSLSALVPPSRVDQKGYFTTPRYPTGTYLLRVSGLPPGLTVSQALHDGRDLLDQPFSLDGDLTGVRIDLTSNPISVTGFVRDEEGRPAAAVVFLFPTAYRDLRGIGHDPRRVRSVLTSETGEFRVTNVPEGEYFVAAAPIEIAVAWPALETLDKAARTATRVRLVAGRPDQALILWL